MTTLRAATLKNRVRRDERCLGVFVSAGVAIEIIDEIAATGLDFVIFDCEHGPLDESALSVRFEIALLRGVTPIVRIAGDGPIGRLVDLGALGIMLAGAENFDEVAGALDAIYFPPLGSRGFSSHTVFGRLANEGPVKRSRLMTTANDAVVVVVQVETLGLRQALPRLLAETRIDVITVGSSDLAVAEGDPDRPSSAGDITSMLGYTRSSGSPAKGGSLAQGRDLLNAIGAAFVSLGHDTELFRVGVREAIERIRSSEGPVS
ncbi:MAG TPA: aldolase/citrate lyase family protein [Acidimicrobiales bacterium]|nr:aldolase/citrate lyase family protein [Acidimicrobiales bacterium]